MSSCTFFGHSDASAEIEPLLRATLKDLIENKNTDLFFVGNHGCFDYMVKRNLKILKESHPHIKYFVVLAYMPIEKSLYNEDFSYTIFPDGLSSCVSIRTRLKQAK